VRANSRRAPSPVISAVSSDSSKRERERERERERKLLVRALDYATLRANNTAARFGGLMAPPSSATDSPGQLLFPASLPLLIENHLLESLFTLRYDVVESGCFLHAPASSIVWYSEASEGSSPRKFLSFVCLRRFLSISLSSCGAYRILGSRDNDLFLGRRETLLRLKRSYEESKSRAVWFW